MRSEVVSCAGRCFSGSCLRIPVIRSATFTTAPRKTRWRRRPMSLRRMRPSAAPPDEVHTMFLTTRGLVLREVRYKESDKILTVLTQHEGR